jgi:hypothetical protein
MIEENQAAKNTGKVTEAELLQIKRIYRRMVKKIHPDINPLTNTNEDLKGLWQRLVIAYDCNDLKEMRRRRYLSMHFLPSLISVLWRSRYLISKLR